MAHIIERVCANDLALPTVAHQGFEESVERLYLSLLKNNAAIIDLGEDGWDDSVQKCLINILPDWPPEGDKWAHLLSDPLFLYQAQMTM